LSTDPKSQPPADSVDTPLLELDDGKDDVREARAAQKLKLRRRGMYALPSLFTLGCLFFGFFGIVQAMNLRFDYAAMSIFAAMIMDSLDGRVARMTGTQTAFGAELDSLADMVSFGAGPALIVYEWGLRTLPSNRLAMAVAFVYAACAALRLARFNVQIGTIDKRFFNGLPSPAAAAIVAGFVWLMEDRGIESSQVAWWALAVTLAAGISMVSTAKFYSFKSMSKRAVSFTALAVAVFAIGVAVAEPAIALFALFVCYLASGYVVWMYHAITGKSLAAPVVGEGGDTKI
jgi:CDP-diacylglycerol---serine O-phosphatidyltransferase